MITGQPHQLLETCWLGGVQIQVLGQHPRAASLLPRRSRWFHPLPNHHHPHHPYHLPPLLPPNNHHPHHQRYLDLSDELEAGKCRTGDCRLNFSDLDDVFSFPGPLVVKTTLDIITANGNLS